MSSLNYNNSYGSRSGSIKRNSYGYGSYPFIRSIGYSGYPRENIARAFQTPINSYSSEKIDGGKALKIETSVPHNVVGTFMGGQRYGSPLQPLGRIRLDESEPIKRVTTNAEVAKFDNPCLDANLKLVYCLKENNNDITKCQNLFDDLKVCEDNLKKRF